MPSRPVGPRRRAPIATVLVTASAVAAATIGLAVLPGATVPAAAAEALAPYSGCDEMLGHYRDELTRTATAFGGSWEEQLLRGGQVPFSPDTGLRRDARTFALADSGTSAGGEALAPAGSGPTGTNLQEQGVDEPDLAKTARGLLLVVARGRLQVVQGGDSPVQLASVDLGRDSFGGELLVDGDRVLVVQPEPAPGGAVASTRLVLVDLAEPATPAVLETLELSGRYLSARLTDGAIRVVTSSTPQPAATSPRAPYGADEERAALEGVAAARQVSVADVLPRETRRTPAGLVLASRPAVSCGEVRHAAGAVGASTLVVTTLQLGRGLDPVDRAAVTTDGDLVYASPDRLYVATRRWRASAEPAGSRPAVPGAAEDEVTTELHGFDTTDPARTPYTGSGWVEGFVLGRWALSSYEGHLRVATTTVRPGRGADTESRVTVLAERPEGLVETGRVVGLGPGETIFAVRWFGAMATVVTAVEAHDPLFVLDLADPAAPRLVGELELPGFSTYLHPVGDERLVGIGQGGEGGRLTGLQAQLFDLADRSTPRKIAELPLDRSGWTPVDDDSRAFSYDPSRRLAVLPLQSWDGRGQRSTAVGVRVGAEGTLREAGRLEVAGPEGVRRVLLSGDRIYAVTPAGIVAARADDLTRTGALTFAR